MHHHMHNAVTKIWEKSQVALFGIPEVHYRLDRAADDASNHIRLL
jgi:hypothetical protein